MLTSGMLKKNGRKKKFSMTRNNMLNWVVLYIFDFIHKMKLSASISQDLYQQKTSLPEKLYNQL